MIDTVLLETKTQLKEEEKQYGVSIDKSKFVYDEVSKCYYLEKVDEILEGRLYSYEDVKSAQIIITNAIGKQVLMRNIDINESFVIEDMGYLIGDNNIFIEVQYNDGTICNEEFLVINYLDDNMNNLDIDFSDNDGDGLINFVENMYKTDDNNSDCDNDGLTDYEELIVLGYNPNISDSDGNGVLDSEEDIDSDGLTNVQEVLYNTDNCTVDSDGDLLTDYQEIYETFTNPNSEDSDGDGANDYWEINNGNNPNEYDEKFIVKRVSDGVGTSVEIEIDVDALYAASFSVEIFDDMFVNDTLAGYLGDSYDFSLDGEFNSAKVKFYFDEDNLTKDNFLPTIYYYNEDEQTLEEIYTIWDGVSNYVTAELEHFSTYCLLDKTTYEKIMDEEIKDNQVGSENSPNYNIVFVLDTSSSMWRGRSKYAQSAIASFIQVLDENDQAGLVTFSSTADIKFEIGSDKEEMYNKLTTVTYIGLEKTAIYSGLNVAIDMLEDQYDDRKDIIILITDGYDEPKTTYESHYEKIVDDAIFEEISIYCIGMSSINEELLAQISTYTGGVSYRANTDEEIISKVDIIKFDTLKSYYDENGDGIPDEYMKRVCEGDFRFLTSAKGDFDIDYDEFQKNDDYDNDGIINSNEIRVVERNGQIYVRYYSDPTSTDTDGDGFSDYQEGINGTDKKMYDISYQDISKLTTTNAYLSSALADTYMNDNFYRAQLFAGNAIFNNKFNYVNTYKEALYNYIRIMNDTFIDEEKIEEETTTEVMFQTIKDIEKTSSLLCEWSELLLEIPVDSYKTTQHYELFMEHEDVLEALKTRALYVENLKEANEVVSDLVVEKSKIAAEFMSVATEYNREIGKVDKHNLTYDLGSILGYTTLKLPKTVKNFFTQFDDYSKGADKFFVVADTSIDILNCVQSLVVLEKQDCQYEIVNEMLDCVISESENIDLKTAAKDVKSAINDDYEMFLSNAEIICEDVLEGGVELGKIALLSKLGPKAWLIDLCLTFGDLTLNIGSVDEMCLKVIAEGETASNISKVVIDSIISDTVSYYKMDDRNIERLKVLCQLRIVAENSYAEVSNNRGGIVKLILNDQAIVEEIVISNIESICDIAQRHNFIYNKKYEGYFAELY